ncbi:transcriptional regulator family: Fungal Specific TF [Penicillium paradoxum]|uniref:transcriptional regulator family: Fungal Specific TF n=1 Tax=Penicillium paradoxum TaxID=176176 RepID=UPI0025483060|nr:transcriptional regulator family: Fungal Specific TF [Penicillium paradoxum]KAJ5794064.1 transcriptional regulator family: Fungal Specific TF [Penicillium paradoxum]
MADQVPVANDAGSSRSPSASVVTKPSYAPVHPLGYPCRACKARHRRCDRMRPVCEACIKRGLEAECSYPSADSPFVETKTSTNKITIKTGAPFSGSIFNDSSAPLAVGEKKRPLALESSIGEYESMNGVVKSTVKNISSYAQQGQESLQPPAKRHKISESGPIDAIGQSGLALGQIGPVGPDSPSGRKLRVPRSVSPTLQEDEMELRCNLTTEINVQRSKHRNLNAACLYSIMKLLKSAKTQRPSGGALATQSDDNWLEEDDLMEVAAIKHSKGGRCSRALLTRFENFLYSPLMSGEEKRAQERVICIEECLSSTNAPPTSNHNKLFLRRLKKIILDPLAYDLDEKHPHIEFLRNTLDAAIKTDSKLGRVTCGKFAQFLDPESEIISADVDSPDPRTGTLSSPRKEQPNLEPPRVPSSKPHDTPSKTTTNHTHDLLSSPSPLSTSHSPYLPRFASAPAPSFQTAVDSIDLIDETMPSPFVTPKGRMKRPTSRNQSSQPADTHVSTVAQSPSKRRAVSGTEPCNSSVAAATALVPATPGAQSSNPNNNNAPNSMVSTSDIQAPSNHGNNSITQVAGSTTSGSQSLASEIPKRLMKIFFEKQSVILPILDLDKIRSGLKIAVSRGLATPEDINATLALCLAMACHLTRERDIWGAQKWYDRAVSEIPKPENSESSFKYFHRRILQTEYLHIAGSLKKAWEILSLALSKADVLEMQTEHGGCLAVDRKSLEQVRLIWHCLWMKKSSLALQLGFTNQCLDAYYAPPLPSPSQVEENLSVTGVLNNSQIVLASDFFIACASLLKHTEDLITLENNLRATMLTCPMKWLSTVELSGVQELHGSLSDWKSGLPESLDWKGCGIALNNVDETSRRMCILAHLRYLYFRLRLYRPFFTLSLRLSRPCTCKSGVHLCARNIHDEDSSPLLGLIYYNAIRCLSVAQEIVKTIRITFEREKNEVSKCEYLDYLYGAALILIAARTSPFLANGTMEGVPAAAATSKSVKAITDEIRQVDSLLRNYQETCEQAPELRYRIQCARAALSLVELQCASSREFISDQDLNFAPIVWRRIYHRLRIDTSLGMLANIQSSNATTIPGRKLTLGWLESLPVDMEI